MVKLATFRFTVTYSANAFIQSDLQSNFLDEGVTMYLVHQFKECAYDYYARCFYNMYHILWTVCKFPVYMQYLNFSNREHPAKRAVAILQAALQSH